MANPAMKLSEARLEAAQPNELYFVLKANGGALTFQAVYSQPAIVVDANGDSSQSAVNSLLEVDSAGAALSSSSTSELDYSTACGSTALGTDAFAIIAKCGDIKRIQYAEAYMPSGTSSAVVCEGVLTNGSTVPPNTLTNCAYVTPAGNLFLRFVLTGVDAASNKPVIVKALVEYK
jgi:hypothetical protein